MEKHSLMLGQLPPSCAFGDAKLREAVCIRASKWVTLLSYLSTALGARAQGSKPGSASVRAASSLEPGPRL